MIPSFLPAFLPPSLFPFFHYSTCSSTQHCASHRAVWKRTIRQSLTTQSPIYREKWKLKPPGTNCQGPSKQENNSTYVTKCHLPHFKKLFPLGTLVYCSWECKLVQLLWKVVQKFPRELKIELSFDLVLPLLGIYPKEKRSSYQKGTCPCIFIGAHFTIAQIWNQPKCLSANEWIKKMYIYILGYHSAIRRKEAVSFVAT